MSIFKHFVKTSLTFLLVMLCFLYSTRSAHADANFDIALKTSYTIHNDGSTLVSHTFTIKNTQPLYAISQYGLKVSSTAIDQVSVTQNGKKVKPEVVTTQNQTSIGVTFPEKIVGQDKTQTLVISYLDPNAAIISGRVLEVAVPKLQNFDNYTDYQVELITPAAFGSPNRVTPANFTSRASSQQVTTTFNKLKGDSIVALFGNEQVFEMSLLYHLENPYNGPRLTQVAFPPDTAYQTIFFHSLEPKPETIVRDKDGNWIATYLLAPDAVTTVELKAQAHVTLEPNLNIPPPKPGKELLHSQEFWEVNDGQVKDIVKDFSSARDSYDYVVNHLQYNYDRLDTNITRLGGIAALQSPDQALCQEFTDAFITLSRASGIYSRRITGYAHTENSVLRPLSLVEDVLHAWPEYYDNDKNLWVPVDPTWDHTSGGINYFDQFDLNHVVFAINGSTSDQPYPAGSYKLENQLSKDVEVSFGNEIKTAPLDITFAAQPKQLFNNLVKLPLTDKLIITNNTGKAFYNIELKLSTEAGVAKLSSPSIMRVEELLPFQQVTLPLLVQNSQPLTPTTTTLTIEYASQSQTITINTFPQIWSFFVGPELLITLGIGLLFAAVATGCLLVFRQRQASSLRR